jgi:hypothetical protein
MKEHDPLQPSCVGPLRAHCCDHCITAYWWRSLHVRQPDNGYILWSFQGKQLVQQSYETFYQLQWRPRRIYDRKTQISQVRKNLKNYEKQFDSQDKERQRALKLEETRASALSAGEIPKLGGAAPGDSANARKRQRITLMGGYDDDDESNYVTKASHCRNNSQHEGRNCHVDAGPIVSDI